MKLVYKIGGGVLHFSSVVKLFCVSTALPMHLFLRKFFLLNI